MGSHVLNWKESATVFLKHVPFPTEGSQYQISNKTCLIQLNV